MLVMFVIFINYFLSFLVICILGISSQKSKRKSFLLPIKYQISLADFFACLRSYGKIYYGRFFK